MWKRVLSIVLIVLSIALAVFLWFRLPDQVATHFGLDGQVTRTSPKILAIGLPLVLTVIASVLTFLNAEKKDQRAFVVAVLGFIVLVATLFFNRGA